MKTNVTVTADVVTDAIYRQANASIANMETGVLIVLKVAPPPVDRIAILFVAVILTKSVVRDVTKALEYALRVRMGFGEATVTSLVSQKANAIDVIYLMEAIVMNVLQASGGLLVKTNAHKTVYYATEIRVAAPPPTAQKDFTEQIVKIGVTSPTVKNVPIAATVKNVNTVTGDQDVPAAMKFSATFATISVVYVKCANMDIGAINVNSRVKAAVLRLVVVNKLACALPARLTIGETLAIIHVNYITAHFLVNVRKKMVPCVTNVILEDGVIFVKMIVLPTAPLVARCQQENVS